MTISIYSKKTMASIAIVVASLGLGCGSGGHDSEYDSGLFRMSDNSVKNRPVVDLNQDFTVSIIAKNNTLLTYTTEAVTNAKYYWTVTDDSNKTVQFYGQESNEITITDTDIKIGKIKVSCTVERGAISHTDDKQFEVDEHAKARLVLQTDASNARASWLANVRSATTNEAKKAYIDKMKLGNEAASKYLILITELDGHFTELDNDSKNNKYFDNISKQKVEITNFLMDEPIIDESYNKMYPDDSLVYSSLGILENRLQIEAKKLAADLKVWLMDKDRTYKKTYKETYGSRILKPYKEHLIYLTLLEQFGIEQAMLTCKNNSELKTFLLHIKRYLEVIDTNIDMSAFLSILDEWDKEVKNQELDDVSYLNTLYKMFHNFSTRSS